MPLCVCVWTRLAPAESRCLCGCGSLILVESGAHSWTIIGPCRCCVQLVISVKDEEALISDAWCRRFVQMQRHPPVTVQIWLVYVGLNN